MSGLEQPKDLSQRSDVEAPVRACELIYAGRLLCWKGVHLAIRALAHARQQGAAATLTVVGDGPARRKLVALAERLGVAPAIRWFGQVPRDQLLGMYSEHHAFLFPSLHDAGGMVVLEAGMHGLPVICLSLGGPGEMVDETSGCVVSTTGRSEEECVVALGSEIVELAKNECRRQQLARGALARSRAYSWPRVAASIYTEIEQCLARDAAAGSRAPVSLQAAREARPCAD